MNICFCNNSARDFPFSFPMKTSRGHLELKTEANIAELEEFEVSFNEKLFVLRT